MSAPRAGLRPTHPPWWPRKLGAARRFLAKTLHLIPSLLWACLALASTALVAGTREQEIATCLPGENATWADGQDRPAAGGALRLVYRHAGAPPWFDEALVRGTVQQAAAAWSACGIPARMISEEAAAKASPDTATLAVVQWNETETRGHFALANLGQRTLSLSSAMFKLLAERNPRHPADQTLQMAISHEMGHFFGLMAHSRRCVDTMSYYTHGRGETCFTRDGVSYRSVVEYRSVLPTACDIARCRAVNGIGR